MEEFKESTRRAFKQCRGDIDSLKLENQRLKDQLESFSQINSKLQETISEMSAEMKGIKIALDYIKSFNQGQSAQQTTSGQNIEVTQTPQANIIEQPVQTQPNPVNQTQVHTQQPQPNYYNQPYQSIPDEFIPKVQPRQDPYDALLAFKAKSNKREMLKQKLISMIGDSGMNLSELKFMFVDHHRYVSKATFYNYLKELEANGTLVQERVNGKNHVFVSEQIKEEITLR